MPRRRRSAKIPVSVVEWLEEASPAEISEALLSVDEAKAVLVGVKVAETMGTEAQRVLDNVGEEFDADPFGTILRGAAGVFSGLRKQ